jgi:hypothetical protein
MVIVNRSEVNPYASPVLPEDDSWQLDDDGISAKFFIEEADQQASVEVEDVPLLRWVIGCLVIFIPGVMLLPLLATEYGTAIAIIAGACVFALVLFGQYQHTRKVRASALAELRRHPVLGRTGAWQMRLTRDWITVTTSGGEQHFPRTHTPIWTSAHQLVFWFGGQPIVVPTTGCYAAMGDELRDWLRKNRSTKRLSAGQH